MNKKTTAYVRLDLAERREIERELNRKQSITKIAQALDRSPSTIAREIKKYRVVDSGLHKGELVSEACLKCPACPRRDTSPYVCNGCKSKAYKCLGKIKYIYRARTADMAARRVASTSRQGIDMAPEEAEATFEILRDALSRGLSPAQIAVLYGEELGVSTSTLYRWIDLGYGDMCNLDLRRKVGYKKRKNNRAQKQTSHGYKRSYTAFCELPEEIQASAWEMDTLEGTRHDTQALLTLFHRPTHVQLVLPLEEKTVECVDGALDGLEAVLGHDSFSHIFAVLLTDNGPEFCDSELLEKNSRSQVYYCDVRASHQKGGCEKNHVEIRKLLPKGKGIRFDELTRADCAYVMSQVNSLPRPSLSGLTPHQMFGYAFQTRATRLLDALGIEEIAPNQLDLSENSVNRFRKKRGEDPLF